MSAALALIVALSACSAAEPDFDRDGGVTAMQEQSSRKLTDSGITSVNGAFDESGKVSLVARGVSIHLQATECRDETDSIQYCAGPVRLLIQGAGGLEQWIELPSLYLDSQASLHQGAIDESYKMRGHSLILSDVNADGHDDLLVWSGKEGAYGGPSYEVYLFEPESRKFAHSQEFSDLTAGYNGLFFVEEKRIRAVSSEGCCLHVTDIYAVESGKPVLIERVIEDSSGEEGEMTRRVERLIDGEMKEVKDQGAITSNVVDSPE